MDRIRKKEQCYAYRDAAFDAVQKAQEGFEFPCHDAVSSAYVHLLARNIARLPKEDQRLAFEEACSVLYRTILIAPDEINNTVTQVSTTPTSSFKH